jgi:hypothetical protein
MQVQPMAEAMRTFTQNTTQCTVAGCLKNQAHQESLQEALTPACRKTCAKVQCSYHHQELTRAKQFQSIGSM